MFFDGVGTLLVRAADALEATGPAASDERTTRQVRMITTLVRRFGTIVPEMFGALEEELAILELTRRKLHDHLAALGETQHLTGNLAGLADRDPLVRQRALLTDIDASAVLLHRHDAEQPGVRAARTDLRRGLGEAAEVEGRLVDMMLAV